MAHFLARSGRIRPGNPAVRSAGPSALSGDSECLLFWPSDVDDGRPDLAVRGDGTGCVSRILPVLVSVDRSSLAVEHPCRRPYSVPSCHERESA